jgi:antitoxin (DNA-binding transcriptional repressor) of toxin-antitoxin stability system
MTGPTMAKLYQLPARVEGPVLLCHIGHMRHVSIRKLHEETGRLVDAAQAGEVIVVRRRGVPVAELRAVGPVAKVHVPDFNKRYAKFPKAKSDSGKILEEDRR